jgi:hypothetical protein
MAMDYGDAFANEDVAEQRECGVDGRQCRLLVHFLLVKADIV